jgi:hypothetical protein
MGKTQGETAGGENNLRHARISMAAMKNPETVKESKRRFVCFPSQVHSERPATSQSDEGKPAVSAHPDGSKRSDSRFRDCRKRCWYRYNAVCCRPD